MHQCTENHVFALKIIDEHQKKVKGWHKNRVGQVSGNNFFTKKSVGLAQKKICRVNGNKQLYVYALFVLCIRPA